MSSRETPVQDVLNQLMKESDNLNAEAFLCRLGAQATGKKYVTAKDGITEIMNLIEQLGTNRKTIRLQMVADCRIMTISLLPCLWIS